MASSSNSSRSSRHSTEKKKTRQSLDNMVSSDHIDNMSEKPIDGDLLEKQNTVQDSVFGEISEDGPNYRNVSWYRSSILMAKTQIGIGVLSIPGAFDKLGMIPGVITLFGLAAITTWSNHTIGAWKIKHPEVYGFDDAGRILFGSWGREIFSAVVLLYMVFTAASAYISVSTCLNALSLHGACTAVFVAVAAIAGWGMSSVRTLSHISWMAYAGLVCILTSIFAVTIAVGIEDRPAAAPQEGPWSSDWKLFGTPTFAEAMYAVSTILFAFTGTPYFFSIISEMREPKQYFKAMYVCQATVTTVYTVIGVVVYYYCGSYVASPALGSAGATMKRVSYGIALPGLLVSSMIVTHIPAKTVFVRIMRNSKHLAASTWQHWAVWLSCTFGVMLCGYILANAVPSFGGIVSLIGALLGTFVAVQPYGIMWLSLHWNSEKRKTALWYFGVVSAVMVIIIGTFIMGGGSYGAIEDIISIYKTADGSAAWSCADNSV